MDLLKAFLLYITLLTGSAVNAAGATPIPYAALHTPTPPPTETPAPTETPTPSAAPSARATATPRLVLMRAGSTGASVRLLQARLQELGYLNEEPDGDFGERTEAAVREFQRMNNLTADGVAGQQTLDKLFNDPAVIPAATSVPQ